MEKDEIIQRQEKVIAEQFETIQGLTETLRLVLANNESFKDRLQEIRNKYTGTQS